MAKVPIAGAVKTRLAGEIGVGTATRFARHAAAALLQRLARDPRWQTTLAVSPDTGISSRCWPAGVARIGQRRGDLGERMQRIMARAAPGPVVIVGTDIPSLTAAHIARAFALLGAHDAVLGPATDGGYWLVGLRRRPRQLRPFARVRWSGPHALADTLANLERPAVAFAATLADVDDAAGLTASAALIGRRVLPAGARSAGIPALRVSATFRTQGEWLPVRNPGPGSRLSG
jgi:rSAM/selenodomain-associated transferase 1